MPTPDEIDELRRQLAAANEQKSQLLTMISDMNNTLTIVLGYTSLIREGGCGETTGETRDALDKIERAGRQIAETIRAAFERELSKRRSRPSPE